MAHFALLRQRIKVIQSIRKTTSAMRLIAMSLQSRLRKQQRIITAYNEGIVYVQKTYTVPGTSVVTEALQPHKTTIILVGSRKGLCGTFNEQLFNLFGREYVYNPDNQIICVGTYAVNHIRSLQYPITHAFSELSITTFTQIAHAITQLLINTSITHIMVYSQHPRTLFIQQPEVTSLTSTPPLPNHDPIITTINRLQLQSSLLRILYNSLLAEQSARFLSMNSATQDAEELLAHTKLEYNKVRQAYVTHELIELTSAFAKTK